MSKFVTNLVILISGLLIFTLLTFGIVNLAIYIAGWDYFFTYKEAVASSIIYIYCWLFMPVGYRRGK